MPTTNRLTDDELVAAVRERCDLSIPKLAALTGYTERHVSRWLAGTQALRAGTRTLLEAMLDEAERT